MSDYASSYRIAYEEAVRALSLQHEMIDSLRTRAGLLLPAAAITTSFLGAQALDTASPTIATWLALAAFCGVATAVLAALWPHRLEFTADSANVIESYLEDGNRVPAPSIHRDLSLHMHNSYVENQIGQKRVALRFRLAGCLLTLEVIFWLIDLASKA